MELLGRQTPSNSLRLLVLTFVIVSRQVASYPVFGTKRYQGSVGGGGQEMPFAQGPVQMFAPQQYGNVNPYGYLDDSNYIYYSRHDPQYHSYGLPMYHGDYKPTPYYYAPGPSYNYYDDRQNVNPLDDLHEEMMQEDERERQRQQVQQQYNNNGDYYPNSKHQGYFQQFYDQEKDYSEEEEPINGDPSYADTNAAFLNNLILYNKHLSNDKYNKQQYPEQEDYLDQDNYYDKTYSDEPFQSHTRDDKAVRELKELANIHSKPSSRKVTVPMSSSDLDYWGLAPDSNKDSELNSQYDYEDDSWINWDSKRSAPAPTERSIKTFTDRKPAKVVISKVPQNHFVLNEKEEESKDTTTVKPSPEKVGKEKPVENKESKLGGQKEVVLLRPATPVRHPFSAPVIKMLENQENLKQNKYDNHVHVEDMSTKKRSSDKKGSKDTVYDTIKHLLSMEHRLENDANIQQVAAPEKSRLSKRFVTNEGGLVQQLDSLKRMSV